MPFAPPNLLILLESLGSNPTLGKSTLAIGWVDSGRPVAHG